MSRIRRFPDWAKAAAGALAFVGAAAAAVACDDDGKTTPTRCADLPIYDIQSAGVPGDDNARYVGDDPAHPCITVVGHAVSSIGTETETGGTAAGGTSAGGTAAGGTAGKSSGSGGKGGTGGTAGSGGKGGTGGTAGSGGKGGTAGSGGKGGTGGKQR